MPTQQTQFRISYGCHHSGVDLFCTYPKINGNILDLKSVYVAFCSILTGT